MSDEFKELYESKLPQQIQSNRAGAYYLVETLKTFLEEWYRDALVKLVVPDMDDDESDEHLDHESFLVQTQNFVGGSVPKLKKKFATPEALEVISSIGFRIFTGEVDQAYIDEFFPQILQHTNKGGKTLIRPAFIPFAKALMQFCQEANSKKSMYKNQREWISKGLTEVKEHKDLLSQFSQAVLTLHGQVDERLVFRMYRRMAEYTMRAYARWRKDREHNTNKTSSLDTSNVAFRTLIQTAASGKAKANKKKKQKKKSLQTMIAQVNAKHASGTDSNQSQGGANSSNDSSAAPPQSRDQTPTPVPPTSQVIPPPSQTSHSSSANESSQSGPTNVSADSNRPRKKHKRTSDDDFKNDYRGLYQGAIGKIMTAKSVGRMSTKNCCAILFVSFNVFHRDTKISAKDARAKLKSLIGANPNWKQQQQPSNATTSNACPSIDAN